jgi:hypothetical protein
MIREALLDYAKSLKRDFLYDRASTVGASEIGTCARRVAYGKRDVPPDPEFAETPATRGTIMEEAFWNPAMRKRWGSRLKLAGAQQTTLRDGPLSATPDGLLVRMPLNLLRKDHGIKSIGNSRCVLIESKTIDPRVNLRSAKAENELQVQVQLGLVRKLTVYKPNYAVISYIDASFWHEVAEFAVRFDPEKFDRATGRAAEILASTPEQLKPEGYISGGQECEHCPWARRCGHTRRQVPSNEKPADKQFTAEVTDWCRHILQKRRERNEADAKVREAEQALKDRLREKSVRRVHGVVTWSAVKGRVSYDDRAIREAAVAKGVRIERYETVGEPTDRLQITLAVAGDTDPARDAGTDR